MWASVCGEESIIPLGGHRKQSTGGEGLLMCRSNYSDAHTATRVSTKVNQIESDSCHLPFLELQDSVSMSVPVPLLPSAPS